MRLGQALWEPAVGCSLEGGVSQERSCGEVLHFEGSRRGFFVVVGVGGTGVVVFGG